MTGYEIPRREGRISFEEGHLYHGAEIICRMDVPMQLFFDMVASQGNAEKAEEINRQWANEALVSWNLEDGGNELPANSEGLMRAPPALISAVVSAWADAIGELPDPLEAASSKAEPSES